MDPIEELTECTKRTYQRLINQVNNTELYVRVARSHWKKPNLYKTEICDHWRNKRKCNYGVRCWYAHGPHELRNMTGLTGNSVGATSTTASDAESPVPNSDLPLQLMPPTDSLSVMTLPNSFETQLSLITSPTQSAPPPYAAIQPNPIQPPMQHFNHIGSISFASNGFNISTSPNVGLTAPFNFASSGFNLGSTNASNVGIGAAPFSFTSSGFNFGTSGLNFSLNNPFNFASSGLNFNTSGINFAPNDLKISRMNIWD